MTYEEKLQEAKRLYKTANSNQRYVLESLFPELKESEDERIRKALIKFHKSTIDVDGIKGEDIIAWLEKQGEQNPAWSEEDSIRLQRIIDFLWHNRKGDTDTIYQQEQDIDWLKSLRPQNNITDEELAQAKKDAYNDALDKIEYHSENPTFDDGWSAAIWYLKKRNAQPQSQWKPSDEQMDALNYVVNLMASSESPTHNDYYYNVFNDLRKQLKKLME